MQQCILVNCCTFFSNGWYSGKCPRPQEMMQKTYDICIIANLKLKIELHYRTYGRPMSSCILSQGQQNTTPQARFQRMILPEVVIVYDVVAFLRGGPLIQHNYAMHRLQRVFDKLKKPQLSLATKTTWVVQNVSAAYCCSCRLLQIKSNSLLSLTS